MRPAPAPRLVAAVAVGGALGALARWWLGEVVPDGNGVPWTTFAINVTGSFALAALPAIDYVRDRQLLAVGLGTGVLGGYTTLSATSEQARALLADGRSGLALAYLVGTLGACVVAVSVAHRLSTPQEEQEFEAEGANE